MGDGISVNMFECVLGLLGLFTAGYQKNHSTNTIE